MQLDPGFSPEEAADLLDRRLGVTQESDEKYVDLCFRSMQQTLENFNQNRVLDYYGVNLSLLGIHDAQGEKLDKFEKIVLMRSTWRAVSGMVTRQLRDTPGVLAEDMLKISVMRTENLLGLHKQLQNQY